jgi:hypothetical protein
MASRFDEGKQIGRLFGKRSPGSKRVRSLPWHPKVPGILMVTFNEERLG